MELTRHLDNLSKEIKSKFDFFEFDYIIDGDIIGLYLNLKKGIKIDIEFIQRIKEVFNLIKQYGFSDRYNYELIFSDDLGKSYYPDFERLNTVLNKKVRYISIIYYFTTNKTWQNEYKDNIQRVKTKLEEGSISINDFYKDGVFYFLIKDVRSWNTIRDINIQRANPYYIYLAKEIEGKVEILSIINFFIPKNHDVFVVNKVYTLPKFRRRGYSFILHKFIQDKTGMKYESNLEFTKSGFLHMLSNRERIVSESKNIMKYLIFFESFKSSI